MNLSQLLVPRNAEKSEFSSSSKYEFCTIEFHWSERDLGKDFNVPYGFGIQRISM